MNLSFSQLGKHGRIGNQLFQIASTLGLAEKYGATASFPKWDYEDYFMPFEHDTKMETNRVAEKHFNHYDWQLAGSADLYGYMQSEKYFSKKTMLRLNPGFVEATIDKTGMKEFYTRPTICIQIRRGDYVGNPNYHQIPVTFYIDALVKHFPDWKSHNIMFVSDDMEYCRVHFECIPNAWFPMVEDIEQMALASMCDNFIIANSSFGWWCAWLGEKPRSKIIYSGYLQAGKLLEQNDEKDYYPERWTQYKRDHYKLDLKDVTFTIPVYHDHIDRKSNLDLSLYILQSTLDTHYIVMEQGSERFGYTAQWAKYIPFQSHAFHRTKMLNEMALIANTEFIVNWDCDVFVPPMQLYMAAEALREGADMVFPYAGPFARMPRAEWFQKVQAAGDIGVVGATPFPGREPDHNSVGGAVMFNKESFIDGGLENENMISFGPEDAERNDRFKLLGYDVQRIGGTLFHMNHFVGINSGRRNPYFNANHRELDKMREMTRDEMRAYINSWPWRNPYTTQYYEKISQGSIRSAAIVMDALYFKPKTVIDIGCGVGEWNNGNPHYEGVDYKIRPEDLLISTSNYAECNLNKEWLGPGRGYDLALCLEVAEHLRPNRAEGLVEMLCRLSDRVLFSAAIPFQGGNGHVNEQWQTWWAILFNRCGFRPSAHQPDIRYNLEVELWYRNNIVLYERNGAGRPVVPFVLPEYYIEIVGNLRSRKE